MDILDFAESIVSEETGITQIFGMRDFADAGIDGFLGSALGCSVGWPEGMQLGLPEGSVEGCSVG